MGGKGSKKGNRQGREFHNTGGQQGGNPGALPHGNPNRTGPDEDIDPAAEQCTDKELLFVDHYVITWNATKAAKSAGYSELSAYSTGNKLKRLPRVKAQIDIKLAEVREDYRQTREAIIDFLQRIIYGDTTDYLEITQDEAGKQVVKFKHAQALEMGAGMLINSITVGRNGIKVEIFSKQQAVDMLNRMMGHYAIDNQQRQPVAPTFYMPDNGRGDAGAPDPSTLSQA